MDYLQEYQYYVDIYDLSTIKRCLMIIDVEKKMLKHKPFKKWQTEEDHKFEVEKVVALMLNQTMADRYNDKEKTIEEWIAKDTKVQNRYDLAQPPNMKCEQCHKKMVEMYRTFKGSDYQTAPLEFTLACKPCHKLIHVDEEGNVRLPEPSRCEKCHEVVHYEIKLLNKDTWEDFYTCSSCGHTFIEKIDHSKFNKRMEKEKKQDDQLLKKYRRLYCLEGETGESLAKAMGNFYLAQDVYEYEYSKLAIPEQEKMHEINRLDIKGIDKLLTKSLAEKGYLHLRLGHPTIDRYVDVPFTVQTTETDEKGLSAVYTLASTLKPLLENTNWRLQKDTTRYRLGYLAGTLRGYENEDDLLKLFESKTPKIEKVQPPDPERMAKFDGHSGWAGLARISAKFRADEDRRQKRLKQSPEGYYLPGSESCTHQCTICYEDMKLTERWYCKYGIICNDCYRNFKNSGIDPKAIEKWDYFSDRTLKSTFNIRKKADLQEFIDDHQLIHHDFVNADGKVYFILFLKDENWKFVRDNPIGHDHPPMTFSDGSGGIFKL